jgi:hypothetical protein
MPKVIETVQDKDGVYKPVKVMDEKPVKVKNAFDEIIEGMELAQGYINRLRNLYNIVKKKGGG